MKTNVNIPGFQSHRFNKLKWNNRADFFEYLVNFI